MKRWMLPVLLLLAVIYGLVSALPAWQAVTSVTHARDYATYHYAVIEAVSPEQPGRGDPYDKAALGERSRAEGTRSSVHPYIYPPPYLLGMLWVVPPGLEPLSLATSTRIWFVINQLCFGGVLLVLWRWFRAHPLLLGLIAVSFSPIGDTAKMGQANLAVLLVAVLGLWRGWGALVGAAAMAKMSPVLYLVPWAVRGRWRPVLAAIGAALALSLLSLPLVPLETQLRFYTQVLPDLSRGDYQGLTVPITLPANHSIPDLFNQLWPGPDRFHLDERARRSALAVSLCLLAVLGWMSLRKRDALGQANLYGALTVVLLLTPVYTYEHHLSMLVLPLAALGQALLLRRLPLWTAAPLGVAYAFLATQLRYLKELREAVPALDWWVLESKFAGAVVVGLLCAWAAARSPEE